jgi:copper(I)-binding protein
LADDPVGMKRALSLFSVAVLALAACGSDDSVTIDGAWARNSAASQSDGAVYFDLTVADADTLVSADLPDSIADRAEVHEVVMADMADADLDSSMTDDSGEMAESEMDDSMDEMDDTAGSEDMDDTDGTEGTNGAMVMQELTGGLTLLAGETVSFEPGSYHIMLRDLVAPLEVGDEFELTLEFAKAGSTTINITVAESAP